MRFMSYAAAVGLAAAFTITTAQAADISGAGATFPYPIYAKWADAYKKETGIGLNYQSIGSGGGIKQIKAGTVTFGATDAPLTGDDLTSSGLAQFPMVMGGIVPVINVEGIKPGELVLDGPTLAKIFMGAITKWDDAAIKKLNPDVKLPSSGHSRRSPFRWFRHDLQFHLLPLSGQRRLEDQGRHREGSRMAGRHRRQGQRGRGQQRDPGQGLRSAMSSMPTPSRTR